MWLEILTLGKFLLYCNMILIYDIYVGLCYFFIRSDTCHSKDNSVNLLSVHLLDNCVE